eukprot:3834925-Pyramimonas_sp.AAC.1
MKRLPPAAGWEVPQKVLADCPSGHNDKSNTRKRKEVGGEEEHKEGREEGAGADRHARVRPNMISLMLAA